MGLVDYPTKKVIASEPVTTVKSFVKDFNVVHGWNGIIRNNMLHPLRKKQQYVRCKKEAAKKRKSIMTRYYLKKMLNPSQRNHDS